MKSWIGIIAVSATAALAGASLADKEADLTKMTGTITIDGSSTVYPITEAVAEEFAEVAPRVRVSVGISGTGGGFKRFCAGETDISDASRPIKKKEYDLAKENKIDFVEIPVAYDGLTIVVNKENDWVDNITVDELKKIFLADSTAKNWSDIRAGWPDTPFKIYAPGTDSGTFDYFKEVVAGKKGSIRSDMSVSEDDNVLVRGVSGNTGAIGFFGCAYFFENKDKLKAVPVMNGDEAIMPTPETIENGTYAPFSRPLFIYVSTKAMAKPQVVAFVDFYLEHAGDLAQEVGYVRLPKGVYARASKNVKMAKTGTLFLDETGEKVHGSLVSVYGTD
ncbi:MAG: PstS family phosphate ABC transporter substrate-binding protein [Planctomycetota bacterium]|nr:PstS family phosphate ABC transporter substrate-binding protein [Planctomycetota bacterium]